MQARLGIVALLALLVACGAEVTAEDDDVGDDAGGPIIDSGSSGTPERDASVDAGSTPRQLAQADELAAVVAYLKANTAYPYPLDYAAITTAGRNVILQGDGSASTYVRALYSGQA